MPKLKIQAYKRYFFKSTKEERPVHQQQILLWVSWGLEGKNMTSDLIVFKRRVMFLISRIWCFCLQAFDAAWEVCKRGGRRWIDGGWQPRLSLLTRWVTTCRNVLVQEGVEERGISCWNSRRGRNRRGQEGFTSIIGVWASCRRRRAAAGSCKNAKNVLASSNVWPLSGGWPAPALNHLIPIQSYPEDTEEMVTVPDIVFTRASSLASGGRTPRRGSLNHWNFSTQ